tara:strand:+ start:132 stop:251 length:120 start_codon:yes stop_codon:yes gene_type:complete
MPDGSEINSIEEIESSQYCYTGAENGNTNIVEKLELFTK